MPCHWQSHGTLRPYEATNRTQTSEGRLDSEQDSRAVPVDRQIIEKSLSKSSLS